MKNSLWMLAASFVMISSGFSADVDSDKEPATSADVSSDSSDVSDATSETDSDNTDQAQ